MKVFGRNRRVACGAFTMALTVTGCGALFGIGDTELVSADGDGGTSTGDGIDADISDAGPTGPVEIVKITAGSQHACALTNYGTVRCWGNGQYGRLGYGNESNVGDNEHPRAAGDVDVGGFVKDIDAGEFHTCAVLRGGDVRCWGRGEYGALGTGNSNNIGDVDAPADHEPVRLGGAATSVTAGGRHSCAILTDDTLKCWGEGLTGKLGYGNTDDVGLTNHPEDVGVISVGGDVRHVEAARFHTCARLSTSQVRCWGGYMFGRLGNGEMENIGDNESPGSQNPVDFGGTALAVTAGDDHTCVIKSGGGEVLCWGSGGYGQNGQGDGNHVGESSSPTGAELLLSDGAELISAGTYHSCAAMMAGGIRCWGNNQYGQLGLGDSAITAVGDDEFPNEVAKPDIGGNPSQLAAGGRFTCALITGQVRCWGDNSVGQLGLGDALIDNVGVDDDPVDAPFLQILDPE